MVIFVFKFIYWMLKQLITVIINMQIMFLINRLVEIPIARDDALKYLLFNNQNMSEEEDNSRER